MIFQYPIKHFQHTLLIDIPLNMVSNCIICFSFLWGLSRPGGFMSFTISLRFSSSQSLNTKTRIQFYTNSTQIMCRRLKKKSQSSDRATVCALEGRGNKGKSQCDWGRLLLCCDISSSSCWAAAQTPSSWICISRCRHVFFPTENWENASECSERPSLLCPLEWNSWGILRKAL